MNSVNTLIRALDMRDPDALPNLRAGSTILIGSDYSGQHSNSVYEALAFILADSARCHGWMKERSQLRAQMLRDGRRFSYKTLQEKQRSAVLLPFLDAANLIPGLLVVVLTRKSIESLFKKTGRIERSDPEIQLLAHWAPHVVEKLLRICHFLSLFIAGLSREGQDVLWITDEDDIVANRMKHEELTNVFGRISNHYLLHTLRNFRLATTASDTGKRDVEDFVSIADLAAGAVCESLNAYIRNDTIPIPDVVLPIPRKIDKKAIDVLNWFSDQSPALKRLVIGFEPSEDGIRLRVRQYSFLQSEAHLT